MEGQGNETDQNTVQFAKKYCISPISFLTISDNLRRGSGDKPMLANGRKKFALKEWNMIQVCYYKGCGITYGEKEPLSDRRITHGLCPMHHEIALEELRAEMEKLKVGASSFKVLIVEDSTLFRHLLKETLHERFPFIQIDEAIDGNEALLKTEASHPDLIFMDIRLPGENGLEITKKIKARYPQIVVIILTGYDLPEYRDASCADYFFSKDTSTSENIFTLIQSIL